MAGQTLGSVPFSYSTTSGALLAATAGQRQPGRAGLQERLRLDRRPGRRGPEQPAGHRRPDRPGPAIGLRRQLRRGHAAPAEHRLQRGHRRQHRAESALGAARQPDRRRRCPSWTTSRRRSPTCCTATTATPTPGSPPCCSAWATPRPASPAPCTPCSATPTVRSPTAFQQIGVTAAHHRGRAGQRLRRRAGRRLQRADLHRIRRIQRARRAERRVQLRRLLTLGPPVVVGAAADATSPAQARRAGAPVSAVDLERRPQPAVVRAAHRQRVRRARQPQQRPVPGRTRLQRRPAADPGRLHRQPRPAVVPGDLPRPEHHRARPRRSGTARPACTPTSAGPAPRPAPAIDQWYYNGDWNQQWYFGPAVG